MSARRDLVDSVITNHPEGSGFEEKLQVFSHKFGVGKEHELTAIAHWRCSSGLLLFGRLYTESSPHNTIRMKGFCLLWGDDTAQMYSASFYPMSDLWGFLDRIP